LKKLKRRTSLKNYLDDFKKMRVIAIASGKGGTGKSTLALNLGISLSQVGKKTLVIDADFAMANLGVMLGIERAPISLHNVLMDEVTISEAFYDGPAGMKYVPAGLSIERIKRMNYDRLKDAVKQLKDFDFVLIDCAPGLEKDAVAGITSAQEVIIVMVPEPSSLADALKVKSFAEINNIKITGIVTNFVTKDKSEIKKQDLETLMGAKVIVELPYDIEVKRAAGEQKPVIIKNPDSVFSNALLDLTAFLSGVQTVKTQVKVKKSFLQNLMRGLTRLFKK
jgi:septum site-determining protein MinD